jgi:hypothetical protein
MNGAAYASTKLIEKHSISNAGLSVRIIDHQIRLAG